MAKKSAGLLIFRLTGKLPEIFLVHPGGPFWKNRDTGAWSIPKGEIEDQEEGLKAAIREVKEETGYTIKGKFLALHPIKQKSGKLVYAWAVEATIDTSAIRSNSVEIPWPPRSGKIQLFPEVDKAAWFSVEECSKKMLPAQLPLVEQLLKQIADTQVEPEKDTL